MDFIVKRIKEPSSWAAISMLTGAISGIATTGDTNHVIFGTIFAALAAFFLPEKTTGK